MKTLLQKYARYNVWANERIALMTGNLDEVAFSEEITSSFSSVRETLLHIWDAELIWLKRLRGESLRIWPSDQFDDPDAKLLEGFLAVSQEFNEFIGAQNSDFFGNICQYKNTKGEKYEQLNGEIIQHCMNHSTFHRGQLITMLRQLGEEKLLSTDFSTFLRAFDK